MPKVPDYREIEIPISMKTILECLEPLLYTMGYVNDNEEIIKIEAPNEGFMYKIKIKKNQPVEIIEHWMTLISSVIMATV